MPRIRIMSFTIIAIIIATVAWTAASGALVDQKSVLTGKVLASGLVSAGAVVHEGDILVVVETITGPVPAVRANIDGKVKEVLVRPGDTIHSNDIAVRIEPAHK